MVATLVVAGAAGIGFGLKVTVAGPVRVTAPVKPPVRATVMVLVPLDPAAMLTLDGLAESEKFAPAPTVRFSMAVREPVMPVVVPVTVIGYVPAGTVAPTVMFAVLPFPVVDAGVRVTVTFAG
jgi:hypothetical protein